MAPFSLAAIGEIPCTDWNALLKEVGEAYPYFKAISSTLYLSLVIQRPLVSFCACGYILPTIYRQHKRKSAESNMLSNTQSGQPRQTIFPDLSDFQCIQWPYLDCLTIPFLDLLAYSIQQRKIIFLAVSAHFGKLTIAYYFFLFKRNMNYKV